MLETIPGISDPRQVLLMRADFVMSVLYGKATLYARAHAKARAEAGDVGASGNKRRVRPDGTIEERITSFADLQMFLGTHK